MTSKPRPRDDQTDLAVLVIAGFVVFLVWRLWPRTIWPWIDTMVLSGRGLPWLGPRVEGVDPLSVAAVALPLLALLCGCKPLLERRRARKAGVRPPDTPWFRQTGPPNR